MLKASTNPGNYWEVLAKAEEQCQVIGRSYPFRPPSAQGSVAQKKKESNVDDMHEHTHRLSCAQRGDLALWSTGSYGPTALVLTPVLPLRQDIPYDFQREIAQEITLRKTTTRGTYHREVPQWVWNILRLR